ncbi:hypothetical protein [Methyloceanibacter caenitepidi]|nr:hypothetical protein [Methyloceanibacter caenitepidi]
MPGITDPKLPALEFGANPHKLTAALTLLLGAYREERLAVFECVADEIGAVHDETDKLRLTLMDNLIASGEQALASGDPVTCSGALGQLLGAYRSERAFVFKCVSDGCGAVREPEDQRLLATMDAMIAFATCALEPAVSA